MSLSSFGTAGAWVEALNQTGYLAGCILLAVLTTRRMPSTWSAARNMPLMRWIVAAFLGSSCVPFPTLA